MTALSAFSAWGIELEYMIVDRESLSVLPIADRLLRDADGQVVNELEKGRLDWSNELTLHLIELKNRDPEASLPPLLEAFQSQVQDINRRLEPQGARLMPGGMHPWMAPVTETRLWPHHYAEIYRAYDRIFGCSQHGFANLQSMHVNLPFADDAEFARLYGAARLILPILPALAASSPYVEGRHRGYLDCRLQNYRTHQIRVPASIGAVIPESVTGAGDYRKRILEPMYAAVGPYDPEDLLQHEWFNARGAIPRFERNALEIRVIDVQECPRADLAIAAATGAAVKALYVAADELREIATDRLTAIFLACIRDAERAVIDDTAYLGSLGFADRRCRAGELWRFLIRRHLSDSPEYQAYWRQPLETILDQGPLARRILERAGHGATRSRLEAIFRELCDCLENGRMFGGGRG